MNDRTCKWRNERSKEYMDGWWNEWINKRPKRTHESTDELMNARTHARTNEGTSEWLNKLVNHWMNGWLNESSCCWWKIKRGNGKTNWSIIACKYLTFHFSNTSNVALPTKDRNISTIHFYEIAWIAFTTARIIIHLTIPLSLSFFCVYSLAKVKLRNYEEILIPLSHGRYALKRSVLFWVQGLDWEPVRFSIFTKSVTAADWSYSRPNIMTK